MPALPAGWTLGRSISVTADDRTFTVAAATITVCPSSTATQTRFYQFSVTSTGHVTGLRAVGKPVTGEAVSEFAASPDGTEVAYAEQGCAAAASAALYAGVIHVMNVTSGAVRSWHNTVSAATPARVTTQIGALSWTADGRTLVADYQWKLRKHRPTWLSLAWTRPARAVHCKLTATCCSARAPAAPSACTPRSPAPTDPP